MSDWILKRYEDESLEPLVEWRKLVGRNKTLDYLEWEFKNGPWGPAETWIAEFDGKIIGQYTLLRYECFFFGKKVIASLSIDNSVHPDYRRRGIYVALEKEIMHEEGKNNIFFSTGFPNSQALPGHLKNNWKIIGPVPLLVNDIKLGEVTSFELNKIEKFEKDYDKLSESFKLEIPIYLNRNSAFLNWRFVEKPKFIKPNYKFSYEKYEIIDKSGEIKSYMVTKEYNTIDKRILHLIDFLVPINEKIYQLMLYNLKEKAKSLGINTISLFINRTHPFSKFLRTNGFNYIDYDRVYIIHDNINKFEEKELLDEKNHFITMGDTDTF